MGRMLEHRLDIQMETQMVARSGSMKETKLENKMGRSSETKLVHSMGQQSGYWTGNKKETKKVKLTGLS